MRAIFGRDAGSAELLRLNPIGAALGQRPWHGERQRAVE
jgi:hypothetical protein